MKLEKIQYSELNARQKESYNFHKIAAKLADYGYTSIRLSDDWKGADFIAIHNDGETDLKVQLKGRLTLLKKYIGRDLYICFNEKGVWYLYPHDEVMEKILKSGQIKGTESWEEKDGYSWNYLSTTNKKILQDYIID